MRPFLMLISVLVLFSGTCGKARLFENYMPLKENNRWVFLSNRGEEAAISVSGDSLISFRDTVFQLFFLGSEMDFLKTANTVLWRFVTTDVVEDEFIVLEDRYYPFFEEPRVTGEKRKIVYEKSDREHGVYFRREYQYEYLDDKEVDNAISLYIWMNTMKVTGNDTIKRETNYSFVLLPDTGFSEIKITEDTVQNIFNLIQFYRE